MKEIRKAKYRSQALFAAEVGLSERGYQDYEQGVTQPTPEILDRFAAKLGVTAVDLIRSPEAREAVFHLSPFEAQVIELVRRGQSVSKHDELELQRLKNIVNSAPDLWEAWPKVKEEQWRKGVALFFLTKQKRYLEDSIPEKARELLLRNLEFFGMHSRDGSQKK